MYIPRLLEEQIRASLGNRKVLLLLGARQVGKTTLIEHLLAGRRGALLNMDIEVDQTRLLTAARLAPPDAVRSLGASTGEILVIDEAHRVPAIGRIVKGWYDAHVPVKIILLGSSSATLLEEAAGELAGRNDKLWLTPLLFGEVLSQQRWYTAASTDTGHGAAHWHEHFDGQIRALLLDRLVFGSYPEAYLTGEPREYLTNLAGDYLLKDIFTASLVRSPDDVRRLLLELAGAMGQTVAVAQLATRLNLSRQTVQRYLDLLEGVFVLFSLPAYATDPVREVSKGRKFYFWDTGVKNALQREWVVSDKRSDMGALWENWVMAEIFKQSQTLRRHEDLFYWRSRNDSTVDLVVRAGTTRHAFDIRWEPRGWRPSLAFQRLYGVEPKLIHPGNVLEFLL